jgi:glycosyltransferase involved in cell wall biosynthesis
MMMLFSGNADKLSLRRKLALPEKSIIITYTGRLVSYKGLPLLMRVANALRAELENVRFVLIGSGGLDLHNCETELRNYVARHELDSIVHFAGEIGNVHEYLQASDIFVFPSEDDAFPVALIEAMASGLPVVTTPVGGIVDIVTHEHNGLIVEPGNAAQLQAALRRLATDASLSAALGSAGAKTVRDRYSMEAVARAYADLLRGLVMKRSSPPEPAS